MTFHIEQITKFYHFGFHSWCPILHNFLQFITHFCNQEIIQGCNTYCFIYDINCNLFNIFLSTGRLKGHVNNFNIFLHGDKKIIRSASFKCRKKCLVLRPKKTEYGIYKLKPKPELYLAEAKKKNCNM